MFHKKKNNKVLFGLLDDGEENIFIIKDAMPSRVKLGEEKVKTICFCWCI